MNKPNTQEAIRLIENGWILKSYKDPFYHHVVWLKDSTHDGPGNAKYITHGVYKNLVKMGIEVVEHKITKGV